jgi:hypothetical protein
MRLVEAELFHADTHAAANSHFSKFCERTYKAQDRQYTHNVPWRPNHFCRGKAVHIKYSERVMALAIRHTKRTSCIICIICIICGLSGFTIRVFLCIFYKR